MAHENRARILSHPALAEFAARQNAETVAHQQRDIRKLEASLVIADRKIRRLETEESLRTKIDLAVDRWLFEQRDFLVYDDGDLEFGLSAFYDDQLHATRFFQMAAAVRSLVRRGMSPDPLLRMRCMRVHGGCGDYECHGCGGTNTELVIPVAITRLMQEARRG